MAGEPVLQEGVSSDWVQYLEQLLQRAGYWSGAIDGEFTSDLTAAVVSYQQSAGLSGSGTVDQATWDALTGAGSSSSSDSGGSSSGGSTSDGSSSGDSSSAPDSGAATGDGGYTGADGDGGYTGYSDGGSTGAADGSAPDTRAPTGDGGYTGADGDGGYTGYSDGGSSAGSGDSSSGGGGGGQVSGVPAFQLTAPAWPLWTYDTDTGTAAIHVELTLTGSLQAAFPNPPANVGLDLSNGAWSVEASNTLNQLSSSLSVGGLGTDTPSIGCSLGNQFDTWGESFQPPNTVKFSGQANIHYTADTSMGPCTIQGTPGFELAVTITPHTTPDPEPVDAPSFWQAHHEAIAIVGGAIILTAAVVLTVATFGADAPVTIPAAAAAAAAL